MAPNSPKPLAGIKVIELGAFIAGPYAGGLMAQFGADVIKIEMPGQGDPLRTWRELHDGTSLWWYSQSRNKKSVTVDLRNKQGQQIVRRLAASADIVLENFKPGTLDKWGLSWEHLKVDNPGLIMLSISGYGQTGPKRNLPGFAAIAEAVGGLRYVMGYPDRPPVRAGVSIGDSLASLYGVIGALLALRHREVNGGSGQQVDVALYESVFAVMESLLPDYSVKGVVRERTGAALAGIVPSNTYRTRDGKDVVIAANSDSIYKRLMRAIGRPDLADDPTLARNDGRVLKTAMLDDVLSKWCSEHRIADVLALLEKVDVPSGAINTAADIVADAQFQSRDMIQRMVLPDGTRIDLPGIVPKLSGTPGETRWIGPELGAHTREVLTDLGIDDAEFDILRAQGTI